MAKEYNLRLSRRQLEAVRFVTELTARLYLGQLSELKLVRAKGTYEDFRGMKEKLFGLPGTVYHGIMQDVVPEEARILFDIYQVIRYKLAWEDAPNTPETRKWPEQMAVIYDEPRRTSTEEPLALVY